MRFQLQNTTSWVKVQVQNVRPRNPEPDKRIKTTTSISAEKNWLMEMKDQRKIKKEK